jgi:hypothetical protein
MEYDDGIEQAITRAQARAIANVHSAALGPVRVVRSRGSRTPGQIFAEASRQMDLDDELMRLRNEWLTPLIPARQPRLLDYFRRLASWPFLRRK